MKIARVPSDFARENAAWLREIEVERYNLVSTNRSLTEELL